MGRILQIRVSASTFDEREVCKRWPCLFNMAFDEDNKVLPETRTKGVLEMIVTLRDKLRFGQLEKEKKQVLEKFLPGLTRQKEELENLLANWQPAQANKASDKVEDELDELEKSISKI